MHGQTRVLVGVVVVMLLGMGPVGAVGPAGEIGHAGEARPAGDVGVSPSEDTARQQVSCDYESLYDRTIGSVVSVRVLTGQGQGLGSGFVYDDEGHVVTNQHVVGNASTVEVQFNRGQWRTAEVVGTDVYSDLAVLDVNRVPDYATPLELADDAPEQGQPVGALGSPLGFDATITDGIVSGTNRSLPAGGPEGPLFTIPNTVQTTAAINPGNSGGPLVNCEGQVVGVNTATLAESENTGFAVPASRVARVVPALIENGSYAHSYLGISSVDVSPLVAQGNDLDVTRGVLVREVLPGGPADGVLQGDTGTAQVQGVEVPRGGDVILAIDGNRIRSGEDLSSYLTQTRPGQTVTMTILRDGERMRVQVELGERPEPGEEL
ncbi:S1C family serine protease [Halorussus salinus]|uniref:S1C family serine protease n=1 Tax=Halorussus salinus TaxID=1364935 RepID=UPI00192F7B48|nr:trypsin-like peptidase domain-containing protein [Halorussus salinus]